MYCIQGIFRKGNIELHARRHVKYFTEYIAEYDLSSFFSLVKCTKFYFYLRAIYVQMNLLLLKDHYQAQWEISGEWYGKQEQKLLLC